MIFERQFYHHYSCPLPLYLLLNQFLFLSPSYAICQYFTCAIYFLTPFPSAACTVLCTFLQDSVLFCSFLPLHACFGLTISLQLWNGENGKEIPEEVFDHDCYNFVAFLLVLDLLDCFALPAVVFTMFLVVVLSLQINST